MTEIKEEIYSFLKKHHTGKENSIHSKELEERYDISGRSLRRVIGSLRRDGVAICSDENGYYYAEYGHWSFCAHICCAEIRTRSTIPSGDLPSWLSRFPIRGTD